MNGRSSCPAEIARPTSSESCASSGHSPCGPASARTSAVAASRSRRSALRSASIRAPLLGAGCENAIRPSTAPPSSLGLHAVEGEIVRRDGHVAAQPQRLLAAIVDFAAALQPGDQRIGIGGLDAERGLETVGDRICACAPLSETCVVPGRAEVQLAQAPGLAVAVEVRRRRSAPDVRRA